MMLSFFKKRAFLPVCIFCTIFFPEASAQQYPFKFFSEEEGLPQSTVYSICEDNRGFLWLGTDGGGLCLLDGNGISMMDTIQNLEGNIIRALLFDSNDILWIGTNKGLVMYDGYTYRKIEGMPGEDVHILCLFEDSNSTLWAGTAEHGCYYVRDQHAHRVENFTTKGIFAINEDPYGRIWVGSVGGIHLISREQDTFVVQKPQIFLYKNERFILSMEKLNEDEFLLGTHGAGIKHVKITGPDAFELKDFKSDDIGKEGVIIWDMQKTSGGAIWIATDKKGVFRIRDQEVTQFNHYNGLTVNQVQKLFEDRDGNMWIGTNEKGLALYAGDEFLRFDNQEFTDFPITGILKHTGNVSWITTYGGGIHQLTFEENSPILKSEKILPGLPEQYITAILEDHDGIIWAGTQRSGLYRIEHDNITRITYLDGLVSNKIYSLFEDHNGILWCGTDAGISLLDGSRIRNISERPDSGLINNEVQCFVEDRERNLWIGTMGGLVRIHGDKMTSYTEEDGLENTEILSLDLQYDSVLWIGTKGGGIFRCEDYADTTPIKSVKYAKGSLSDNIRSLNFLNDTLLIAGTDRGLMMYVLNAANDIVYMRKYDARDGFFGGEIIQNGMEKLSGNTMLICTIDGVTRFSPDLLKMKSKPVSAHIDQIDLFYKNVDWRMYSDSIVPFSQIPCQLKLKPGENHLTFHVATDNIPGKSIISYRYQLLKGKDNWSPLQDAGRFDFMNIPFGRNSFRIRIESDDDYYQDSELIYDYEIRVPFYLQWWFYVLLVLVMIAAVFVIIRYRERALRKRNEILEDTVLDRTVELRMQKFEVEKQKGIIEIKNKDITDSIRAAKYIQDAVLPSTQILNTFFADSFIIYWPKDIVSGDFYWIKERKKDILITAADCTGHGVPGAFMSLLGISFLNNMVDESGNDSPAGILNKLRDDIVQSLNQKEEGTRVKSGMDAALIAVSKDKMQLEYAGAYNPLILVRDHELTEMKADKMPIAYYDIMEPFTNHSVSLEKGDQLYFFSDGFADQFGGPQGKKIKRGKFYNWLLEVEGLPFQEQSEMLEKKFNEWRGEGARIDDVVLIGIKI